MNNDNVITPEELEEGRREEMRELLIEAFEDQSVLYEIYKQRGWLDRLFTENILSMDKNLLYTSNKVAEICETHDYLIKNKRRELLDYVAPTVMGDGNTKIYKHNYISVFKLKMIHGLTGEGSEYTIPEIKELLYGKHKPSNPNTSNAEIPNDLLVTILNKMDQVDEFLNMIKSDKFYDEIKRLAKDAANEKLLESSNDQTEEIKSKVSDLYQNIISSETNIDEKERMAEEIKELEFQYPDESFVIKMYRTGAEEKIAQFKQELRNMKVIEIKQRVIELFNNYEIANSQEREKIHEELNRIAEENIELNFEIRFWFSNISKKKKGFLSRFFN